MMKRLDIGMIYDIPEFNERWKLTKVNKKDLSFIGLDKNGKELDFTITHFNKEKFIKYLNDK